MGGIKRKHNIKGPAVPIPILKIEAWFYPDGKLKVSGFPANLPDALVAIHEITKAIVLHLASPPKEESRIVTPFRGKS